MKLFTVVLEDDHVFAESDWLIGGDHVREFSTVEVTGKLETAAAECARLAATCLRAWQSVALYERNRAKSAGARAIPVAEEFNANTPRGRQ